MQSLSCMEVWGGNQATCSSFAKAGLDIWLYSRPCGKHVNGGDVYYLSSCASGRITRMLLADVAGHGETVAGLATELRRLMRRYINSICPRKLFEEVNADFARIPSGDRFATSIMNSYFMPTSTLSVCNAGHPTPLLRKAGDHRWEPLKVDCHTDDMPLGITETAKYTQLDIPVNSGDLVLCYTDGVMESLDADGHQLGVSGLCSLLNELPADRPELMLPKLVEQITARADGGDHEDDVTLLLYRITDRAIPLRDNLAAPWRWLRNVLANWRA
jgi:serine phosphatase RsbU (regulator of sigma subunit)